jgi:hypothetical protein
VTVDKVELEQTGGQIMNFFVSTTLAELSVAALVASGFATSASATIAVDFEGIAPFPNANNVAILQAYNGGFSSISTSASNIGVSFAKNAFIRCLNSTSVTCSNYARDGIGNALSRDAGMYINSTVAPVGPVGIANSGKQLPAPLAGSGFTFLDYAAGFKGAVSFVYASSTPGSVEVYDGLGGTGALLGSVNLAASPGGGCPAYNALYCPFSKAQVQVAAGIGRSVVFSGITDDISFDDVVLGVPEPASWALMITGFGLVGGTLRRRRLGGATA